MNHQEKQVGTSVPRKLIDYTNRRGDKNYPPLLFKNKMDCVEMATTLPLSSPLSKKLPPCRREIPSTIAFSCMNSLDRGYKSCQKPAVEDVWCDRSRSSEIHTKCSLVEKCRQCCSSEIHTKARKCDCDSMTGRICTQQHCDLSRDGDAKDTLSSRPHFAQHECSKTSPCWESAETLVDFYLKIPSQTSIQHRTRSDLRERYQIHGRTRRLGIVQNLLTTSFSCSSRKAKSMPGGRLLRGLSEESPTSLDDSFASSVTV